jgi:peptide/nickel transport system substrate-binding protein
MVISSNFNFALWDPYVSGAQATIMPMWMEKLYGDNWALDPSVFDFSIGWRPSDYVQGCLASSWEFTDASTYVIHVRQGVHWQNVAPVNGREFTSDDIVFHYDREYGLGGGFTKPAPALASTPMAQFLGSITATDKYTVVMKWKSTSLEFILETLQALGAEHCIEAKEAVQQYGDLNDWHHAVGTGPFILSDFVSGSSATLTKNPNYWGYDERYPQNQLPYVDQVKFLVMPDASTALAAIRTGKIDVIDNQTLQNAQSMKKTNPDIMQMLINGQQGTTVDPRVDVAPYNDIRVREAMQLAIDLNSIATNYYGGTAQPTPLSLTSYYEKGLGYPYDQWPQDLKDQYAYNVTAAKKLLADAGFPNGFKTDVVADASGDLDLLQIVKSYYAAIGIDMEIRTMDAASWTAFVRTGHKQDALAYRSSGSLAMSYEPLRQFVRYQTGYVANYELVADPTFDAFYTKALAATTIDGVKAVLKDANDYQARQHWVTSLLIANLFAFYQPWFKGYNGQAFAVSGGSSGPLMAGYYTSRFWIDQSVKKSLGH